ncbi:hypothetical protein K440DRAFT_327222 [Wilcoxina mikolae CBS 423.85]|nr:hypothetical protein K440DRAFT_327222 [Wilcoxina mikolae CBS 423.85]
MVACNARRKKNSNLPRRSRSPPAMHCALLYCPNKECTGVIRKLRKIVSIRRVGQSTRAKKIKFSHSDDDAGSPPFPQTFIHPSSMPPRDLFWLTDHDNHHVKVPCQSHQHLPSIEHPNPSTSIPYNQFAIWYWETLSLSPAYPPQPEHKKTNKYIPAPQTKRMWKGGGGGGGAQKNGFVLFFRHSPRPSVGHLSSYQYHPEAKKKGGRKRKNNPLFR